MRQQRVVTPKAFRRNVMDYWLLILGDDPDSLGN